jgi:hypothetical protein
MTKAKKQLLELMELYLGHKINLAPDKAAGHLEIDGIPIQPLSMTAPKINLAPIRNTAKALKRQSKDERDAMQEAIDEILQQPAELEFDVDYEPEKCVCKMTPFGLHLSPSCPYPHKKGE